MSEDFHRCVAFRTPDFLGLTHRPLEKNPASSENDDNLVIIQGNAPLAAAYATVSTADSGPVARSARHPHMVGIGGRVAVRLPRYNQGFSIAGLHRLDPFRIAALSLANMHVATRIGCNAIVSDRSMKVWKLSSCHLS